MEKASQTRIVLILLLSKSLQSLQMHISFGRLLPKKVCEVLNRFKEMFDVLKINKKNTYNFALRMFISNL